MSARLAVVAILAALGAELLFAACGQSKHRSNTPVVGGLQYSGSLELVDAAPTRLHAQVSFTNVSDETIHLEYGACALTLLAFDGPAMSGVPLWDSAQRREPVSSTPYACPDSLSILDLAPGESASPKEMGLLIPLYEIVGHPLIGRSLPDGLYHWLAQVEVNDDTIELPMGEATLTMYEPPLPAERTAGGLVYQVSTTAGSTGSIEATLAVVNNGAEPASTALARDCPFDLYFYRDQARRDAAYVAGEPNWRRKDTCYLEMVWYTLSPGDTRAFTLVIPAAEVLADSITEGQYYLAAVVWLKEGALLLAAGDMQLRR